MRSTDYYKYLPALFWTAATITISIPMGIAFSPLIQRNNAAKDALDAAEAEEARAQQALATAENKLIDAKKRIVDLTCAIRYVTPATEALSQFVYDLTHSSIDAISKLSQFFHLSFKPNHEETDSITLPGVYYTQQCHEEEECSTDSKGHEHCHEEEVCEQIPHYYTDTITTNNYYANMLNGELHTFFPVECGYYSRSVTMDKPRQYLAHKDQHSTGSEEQGEITDTTNNYYSSKQYIRSNRDTLESSHVFLVSPDVVMQTAAGALLLDLTQFMTQALSAFAERGPQYYLHERQVINASLPLLYADIRHDNATLINATKVVAEKQHLYDLAHAPYMQGLALWLPQFFLIPAAAALAVYAAQYAYKRYKRYKKTQETAAEPLIGSTRTSESITTRYPLEITVEGASSSPQARQ